MRLCHIGDILQILGTFSEIENLQDISCVKVYKVVLLGANSQFKGHFVTSYIVLHALL